MRTIDTNEIYKAVKEMALACCVNVDGGVVGMLKEAATSETNDAARFAIETIIKSDEKAARLGMPACQDTGMAVIFLEIGQDVSLTGEYVGDAVNRAVKEAYAEGYFRKSVLDPLDRINTKTNLPAVIHTEIVRGDKVKVSFLAKGFGSENMSRVYMLTPSKGVEGVIDAVVATVKLAGSNPCPPVIVGVGIGGTFEKAAYMSKKCLLREVGSVNPDKTLAGLEQTILDKINALEIGAQGFGGNHTCLAVYIDKFPTHLAGLPVAINVQCHSVRHDTKTI